MSKRKHKHKNKGRLLTFIKLHRWSGLVSLILVIILSITGILLNHTHELQLKNHYIKNTLLLNWYGIRLPEQQTFFKLGANNLVQVGHKVYLDNKLLASDALTLIGGIEMEDYLFIALENAALLLTLDGELIEKLTPDQDLPVPITSVYKSHSQDNSAIVIQSHNKYFISDDDYLTWTNIKPDNLKPVTIKRLKRLSETEKEPYYQLWLDNKLSLETVVLDLHSGRILGQFGVFIMDLAASFLLVLSISGFWIWFKRSRKQIRHRL